VSFIFQIERFLRRPWRALSQLLSKKLSQFSHTKGEPNILGNNTNSCLMTA